MFFRMTWLAPLVGVLTFGPSFFTDSCGGGDPTPTPTPEPTVTPAPTPEPGLSDKAIFDQYVIDLKNAASTDAQTSLTNKFMHTIEYSNGFPIVEGNSVTFVYVQQLGIDEPLRVSGQFNSWNATSTPMVKAASNYWVFYATISVSNATQYSMYKFVGKSSAQDIWFADPAARRYQYDSNGMFSLISGGTQSQPSHLEHYPAFYSDILGNTRDLYLYMPPGYDHETNTYPVLYMHDGQNLFDPNASYGGWKVDKVVDGLLAQGKMQEVIVVGMANTPDRMDEYTQVTDYLAGSGTLGGQAPEYTQFVVDEVKPFIDAQYRTRPGRESTAVLGSSLGGLVSLYMGYAATETFKYVGGMSSTLGWGSINLKNETMIQTQQKSSKLAVIYYVDSGGDDGGGCVDSDGDGVKDDTANADDNFCETAQFRDVLKTQGYSASELEYEYSPGQEHNEASWNSRLHYPLTFWFPAP